MLFYFNPYIGKLITVISFFQNCFKVNVNKNSVSSYLLKVAHCLLVLIIITKITYAQSYRTINYTVENGLPSSEVYQVIQDRQGYIWLATNQGVSRFNGYEFQNFGVANGLAEYSTLEIYEDYKGRIWFISLSGRLSYFYRDSIYTYKYNETIQKAIKSTYPPVKMGFFVDMAENVYLSIGSTGIIMVSSIGEATIMDARSDYYPKYAIIYFANHEKALGGMAQYRNFNGISILKNNQFTHIPYAFNKNGATRMGVVPYKNKILLFHIKDLLIIENNQIVQKYSFDSDILWLSKEDNGHIWISINKRGIYLFTNTDHFSNPDAHFLKGLSVSSVIKDVEGANWFTTLEKGVFYIPSKDIKAYTSGDGLKATKITTVDAYKDKVWFAGNHSELYNLSREKLTAVDYFNMPDGYYQFIKCCHDKIYMAGNIPGSFNVLDKGRIKNVQRNYYKNIFFTRDNEYYMLYPGIEKYNKDKKVSNGFSYKYNIRVYCMSANTDGSYWIGSDKGLLLFKNEKIEDWSNTNKLLKCRIQDLVMDTAFGNLWIATKGGGLLLKTRDTIVQFTTKDGLPSNSLYSLFSDGKDLWIGTSQGLAKLETNPNTKKPPYKITGFQVTDGLISNEINDVLIKNNTVYLATSEGLCFFDKTKIKQNSTPPPIYIKGIKINDKDTSITSEYRLPYDKNNITIEYIGLSYRNAGKIDYIYNMEGIDNTWRTTKSRITRFPLLPPGKYIFRVRAYDNAGIVTQQTLSYTFIIKKPYWQTWWFLLLVVLMLFSVSFLIFYLINRVKIKELNRRRFLKKNMRKFQKQAATSHIKSRFFANISHEFRTPLSLIIGPLESLMAKTTDKNLLGEYSRMLKHSSRLLLLINQLLDISKIEKGKLQLELTEAQYNLIIHTIVSSYYPIAKEKGITFHLTESDSNIQAYFDIDKLEKIFYNLLSNAFKFTDKGGSIEVLLQLTEDAENVEILVKDSGIGIPPEKLPYIFDRFYQVDGGKTRLYEGTGIGLALTKELVELHKGSIEVISEPGKGTEFKVRLPLDKSVYADSDVVYVEKAINGQEINRHLDILRSVPEIEGYIANDYSNDKKTILIVEDNEDMLSYISQHVREKYRVEEAKNGQEGIDKALEMQPDLILSDIMMPTVDGLQMTKLLKENPLTCHIPVILLTAKASQESKLDGFELFADDYVTKPFNMRELLARINAQLANRQMLRSKFERMITVVPSEVTTSSLDEKFLRQALQAVEANLCNSEFSVDDLCKELAMSRTNIHVKLKAITNQNTSEFIRSIRLKRAAQLIKQNEGTITEIAYMVGFASQPYFSHCFKEYFKVSPTEYQ
jgi:signal transduction histidine kinase/DNA-binding response OmpR family regulator/ligand-binding sensor domain-containing protein